MADITAVVNGRHVSIEVKTGRDKPRLEQMKVKRQIEHTGGIYIFAHSFDEFLEQIQLTLISN
jgi:predicted transcriptional regulator